MKIITARLLSFALLVLAFSACDGSRGPVGPEGPPGPEILPTSFEFETELTAGNNFEFFYDIPDGIDVFESDMMLVYVLEDYIEEDDLDVWRQLPITEFTSGGTRVIDFDFTLVDVRIFMDANYPLSSADNSDEFWVRAVHVPAEFLNGNKAKDIRKAKTIRDLEALLNTEIRDVTIQ